MLQVSTRCPGEAAARPRGAGRLRARAAEAQHHHSLRLRRPQWTPRRALRLLRLPHAVGHPRVRGGRRRVQAALPATRAPLLAPLEAGAARLARRPRGAARRRVREARWAALTPHRRALPWALHGRPRRAAQAWHRPQGATQLRRCPWTGQGRCSGASRRRHAGRAAPPRLRLTQPPPRPRRLTAAAAAVGCLRPGAAARSQAAATQPQQWRRPRRLRPQRTVAGGASPHRPGGGATAPRLRPPRPSRP